MTMDPSGNGGVMRADAGVNAQPAQYTGAHLVLLDPRDAGAGMSALTSRAGVAEATHIHPQEREHISEILAESGAVILDELGVAIVTVDPDQQEAMMQAAADAPQVYAVEPERVLYAFTEGPSLDYVYGFRDGVNTAVEEALAKGSGGAARTATLARTFEETRAAWGLQATRATESAYTGRGVRVAVLDTGMNATHRDFVGRPMKMASFIPGESVEDGNGHGTHCIGTACGPKSPHTLPRYGVATEAHVHVGKVLSNAGSGGDRSILAGIAWAISEGCRVISMSLGSPSRVGDTYSRVYEAVAQRALAAGTLIVAAAGNHRQAPGTVPVSHPANCPSIMAVGALTPNLTVAPFSCSGLNPDGGQVDIAGPGVNVLSSYPEPTGYRRLSGTSMATPHVSGVLALLAEAHPNATPAELKVLLFTQAQRLPLAATEVGAGLVQAP
ncbi:S8 family serine peptidase [Thermopolyspora sp. NPDC052614]|uniref:S8 family serine peptidase n=1 Tax=Thermopolyspora sp. NPDC052614 TaxID=3155682 RepID=UPI003444F442